MRNYYRPPRHLQLPLDSTSELHACLLPNACNVNHINYTHYCNSGYTGVLCSICDAENNYSKIGDTCAPCLPQQYNKIIAVLLILFLIGIVGYFVLHSSATAKKSKASISLRILLTHVQAVTGLRAFTASGTDLYKSVTSWMLIVSPSIFAEGPMQCAIRPNYSATFFIILLAPIIATSVALLFLLANTYYQAGNDIKQWCGKAVYIKFKQLLSMKWHDGKVISIVLFVAHLGYMPIINTCINIFKCTQPIDNVRYLIADLRVTCEGSEYGNNQCSGIITIWSRLSIFYLSYIK